MSRDTVTVSPAPPLHEPTRYGAVAFVVAWSWHLLYADRFKDYFQIGEISGDAFGPFTTLIGLVFSLQLGQTYSYYFDRQGAIQDAAFREISELQRLLELVLNFAQALPRHDLP